LYSSAVKRGELERRLKALGWYLHRHGGNHDVWAHASKQHRIYVPRHPVINMNTARRILGDAER
jgi:predicted RNA binding protein YcfA (HicA-like mRNA interferase family)